MKVFLTLVGGSLALIAGTALMGSTPVSEVAPTPLPAQVTAQAAISQPTPDPSPTLLPTPSPSPTPSIKSVSTKQPTVRSSTAGTPKAASCDPNYSGACVPIASDVDCAGGSGNGPAYVRGPVYVTGSDIYGLDRDGDGVACE